jgi:ABC-type multidrug transport system fused ATPase/permease subunit
MWSAACPAKLTGWIAPARAFLKDALVLLLDEPTSAVDAETEAGILETMGRLMRGRTSIIITHRPRPLTVCDQVLALEGGQVIVIDSPVHSSVSA